MWFAVAMAFASHPDMQCDYLRAENARLEDQIDEIKLVAMEEKYRQGAAIQTASMLGGIRSDSLPSAHDYWMNDAEKRAQYLKLVKEKKMDEADRLVRQWTQEYHQLEALPTFQLQLLRQKNKQLKTTLWSLKAGSGKP